MGRRTDCDSVRKTGSVLVSVKFWDDLSKGWDVYRVAPYFEKEPVFQARRDP